MDSVELTLEDKENLINFLDRVPLTGHRPTLQLSTHRQIRVTPVSAWP